MKKKKMIIIVAVLLLVLAVAAVVLLRMKGKDDAPPEEEPDPVVPAPIVYELKKDTASVVALPVGESVIVTEEKPKKEEKKEEKKDSKEEADKQDEKDDKGKKDDKESKKSKKEKKKDKKAKKDKEKESETADAEKDAKEGEAKQPKAEKETGPEITLSVTYHYAELPEPVQRIQSYYELLTAEDFGFVPVDEKIMVTKSPDFEAPGGTVNLVHPIEGEGEESLFSLQIAWQADGTVSVAVAQIAGGIVEPPKPQPMTLEEAEDFFYNSDPALFGLSGDSMRDYEIFALDGTVLVGTTPCLRMNVYQQNEKTGTNEIVGQYLLSNTGYQLYWVGADGQLQEISH